MTTTYRVEITVNVHEGKITSSYITSIAEEKTDITAALVKEHIKLG